MVAAWAVAMNTLDKPHILPYNTPQICQPNETENT